MLENLLIVPLALVIDLLYGEYHPRLHPVVWMGHVITWLLRAAPKKWATLQFIYGVLVVLVTAALFSVPVFFLMDFLREELPITYILTGALLLKSTFSLRELRRTAENVKRLLDEKKLNEARKQTGFLVSRDTSKLDRGQIASAVIEMISESVTDSVAAPLFFWLLFGVPGALFYRVVNTFDARIGYRGDYEYLGKFAARLDDVLNFIPAHLSALLIVVSTYLLRMNGINAWRTMWRDHGRTASPNAGWTMAAVAGALKVRLEKPGHYRLGQAEEFPEPAAISAGLRLVMLTCYLWFGVYIIIAGVRLALAA